MADENEVWSGNTYKPNIKMRGYGKIIGIIVLILFIELPLTAVLGFSLGVVGSVVGLIIIILTVIFGFRLKLFKKPAAVNYVLTNKRALVIMGTGESQDVLQECDLQGCQVVVHNMEQKTVSSASTQGGTSSSETYVVGDVVFLKNGVKQLTFTSVLHPDGVRETANNIIDQLNFAGPSNP